MKTTRTQRIGRALAGVGLLGLMTVGWAVTPTGEAQLASWLVSGVQGLLSEGWVMEPVSLGLGLDGRVTLEGVMLRDPWDRPVVSVRRLDLRWSPWALLGLEVRLDRLRADGVMLRLDVDEQGALALAGAFQFAAAREDEESAPWGGLPVAVDLRDIGLEGVEVRYGAPAQPAGGEEIAVPVHVVSGFLSGHVRLPRAEPTVALDALSAGGALMQPAPLPWSIQGDAAWEDGGISLSMVTADVGASRLVVDGRVDDVGTVTRLGLDVLVQPLDLGSLNVLLDAGLDGTYEGGLSFRGPPHELAVQGQLSGRDGTRGQVTLWEGSMVCLPIPGGDPDACVGTPSEGPPQPPMGPTAPTTDAAEAIAPETARWSDDALPLRWSAALDSDDFNLSDVLPVIAEPIILNGHMEAWGYSGAGHDLHILDGRWDGEDMDIYGVPVRSVGADLALVDGVVWMEDLDVTGVAGTVRGRGSLALDSLILELDAYGPLDLSMLEDMDITGLGGTGSYRARLRGLLREEGVPIYTVGTAELSSFTFGDDVYLGSIAGDVEVDVVNGVTVVRAEALSGLDGEAYGLTLPTYDVQNLRVMVDESAVAEGVISSERVDYGDLAWFTDVRAPFRYADEPGQPLRIASEVRVGAHAIVEIPASDGRIGVFLEDDLAHVDVDLRRGDEAFFVAPELDVDLSTMSISSPTLLLHPTSRQRWTATGPSFLRLVDGGVEDARLTLRSPLGELQVDGTIGRHGRLAGRLQSKGFDLSALAELFPDELSDLYGILDMTATLRGRASQPEADIRVKGQQLNWPDVVHWLDVDGHVRLREDVATVDLDLGADGVPLARIDGFAPVHSDLEAFGFSDEGQADLAVVIEPGRMERFSKVFDGVVAPAGSVSGILGIRDDLRDPEFDVRLAGELDVPRLREKGRFELHMNRRGGQIEAGLDLYEGLDVVARIDGSGKTRLSEVMSSLLGDGESPDLGDLALYADDLVVTGELTDLSIPSVLSYLDVRADLTGGVGGHVVLTGHPTQPFVQADLTVDMVAGKRPARMDLVVEPADGGYALELELGDGQQAWTRMGGHVPLAIDLTKDMSSWNNGQLDLRVSGDGIPLALAESVVPELDVVSGVVGLDGVVRGGVYDPRPDVAVSLGAVEAAYLPLGVRVLEAESDIHVQHDPTEGAGAGAVWVDIDRLQMTTTPIVGLAVASRRGGTRSGISVEGGVGLALGGVREMDLQVVLDRAWLARNDDFRLQSSGALTVQGLWPALGVSGQLNVDQGSFVFDARQLLETRDLRLDPRLRIHMDDLAPSAVASVTEEEETLYDHLDLDLQVNLWGNVDTRLVMPVLDDLGEFGAQLTRLDVQTNVSGSLAVGMQGGEPSITGELELPSGTARLLQSRFELAPSSRLEFLGSDYANPRINIGGKMEVGTGSVGLDLGGTAGEPTMTLSSEEFTSDAELFTVLLTGKAPEELSAEQGQAALEAVGDLLLNSVLGGGDFGSFSVAADGTVRVGVPLGRAVFVETSVDPVPRLNENRITVAADINVLPRLVLDLAYGDRLMWARILWETRF